MEYYENNTYLVFDSNTNLPLRWNISGELNYFGNVEDAMMNLDITKFYTMKISDCNKDLQLEYRKLIDKEL